MGFESLIKDSNDFSRLEYVQLKWVAVWLIDSGCFCWVIMFGTVYQLIFYQFTCHTLSDIMDFGTSQTLSSLWNKCPTFLCGWIHLNLFTCATEWGHCIYHCIRGQDTGCRAETGANAFTAFIVPGSETTWQMLLSQNTSCLFPMPIFHASCGKKTFRFLMANDSCAALEYYWGLAGNHGVICPGAVEEKRNQDPCTSSTNSKLQKPVWERTGTGRGAPCAEEGRGGPGRDQLGVGREWACGAGGPRTKSREWWGKQSAVHHLRHRQSGPAQPSPRHERRCSLAEMMVFITVERYGTRRQATIFFFFFLWPHLQHTDVTESELQLWPMRQVWQHRIL